MTLWRRYTPEKRKGDVGPVEEKDYSPFPDSDSESVEILDVWMLGERGEKIEKKREEEEEEFLKKKKEVNAKYHSNESVLEALKSNKDPKFEHVTVTGDGNCFFRALAQQHSIDMDHKKVRQMIVKELNTHRSDYQDFLTMSDEVMEYVIKRTKSKVNKSMFGDDYTHYVLAMSCDQAQGGEMEAKAASEALECSVTIFKANLRDNAVVYDSKTYSSQRTSKDKEELPKYYILHERRDEMSDHYSVVKPVQPSITQE